MEEMDVVGVLHCVKNIMNRKLFVLMYFFIFVSCNRHSIFVLNDYTVYKVEKYDGVFYWDDFVDKFEIIPLETNANSIIGELQKGIVTGDDIYIFDFMYQSILNFDIEGNFKREISKKGRGPDEYIEARDFHIIGDNIYVLDYQKIHRYCKTTGDKEDTWIFETQGIFNPVNMFIFDKNNYFLWDSKPYTSASGQKEPYMRKMQNGSVIEKFFFNEIPQADETTRRFQMIDEYSCYIRPIDDENIVYKLRKDTLIASFKIDFGRMAMTIPEIKELLNNNQRDVYLRYNKFKNISTVLEVNNYIYFSCIGPKGVKFEGIISKHTGNVTFGVASANPIFFFSDGTFLYGYYDQFSIDSLKEYNIEQHCFYQVWSGENQYNIEDNLVLVKVLLK